jgi:hypothetical protein
MQKEWFYFSGYKTLKECIQTLGADTDLKNWLIEPETAYIRIVTQYMSVVTYDTTLLDN